MKRPKLKKASKRVSCAKRYKIQKKIREHHKKLRREAKKKGVKKRVKKDPGVPNSAPFKEEVLREAEQRRLQIEEEKEKRRQAAKEERAQKRKKEKEAASKETEPKAKKSRKEKDRKNPETIANRTSKHSLCVALNKVVDAADVVLQVLDARDPLGSRCPQLEEAILQRGTNKKLIFVLNKIDLVPKDNVEKWIQCLQKEFPVVAFKASTQILDKTVKARRKRIVTSNAIVDLSRAATCCGNTTLMNLLSSYAANLQGEAVLRVGVVGFPNVGKSSLINSLKEVLACNVGPTGGVTKSMQEVYISKNVKLIDSPGVVASPSNPADILALRGLQNDEDPNGTLEAVRTLLKQCDKTQIMLQYFVADFRNSLEFLTLLAKRRGFAQKGGAPNTEQSARSFLSDWTGAKLSYHCKVPDNHSPPSYLSDTVIAEMQNGWDLQKLAAGNEETLSGAKFPHPASSISFISKGPTAGLLCADEIPKEVLQVAVTEEEAEHNNENDEPEETEDLKEEEEEEEQPQKMIEENTKQVHFQPVPIDISYSAGMADDAYDFNTDYK